MRAIALVLLTAAGEALAHSGHGMPAIHLHWWEYALIGALAVCGLAATIYVRRK